MTIVLFLFNWSCINWSFGQFLGFSSKFFFDSCSSGVKHLLKLFGLNFSFGNSLNMFTVCIYSWVFKLIFFLKSFLFSGICSFFL